ncbi:DEAD/DEAH box helicase [Xylella fastidiosa subsp. multiplex]|uniref:ATP-dependent RNA helicase DeaD n=1 Tax=Xylella fastidiosa subsp. multiplex TaxID=644357 RepID=A0A9Q4MJA6_XYLFS|nr:DEAD/DEAH box helicase [Xylella fastidiosa]ERI60468.1 RNA helicase [Xylella fastidiosa subsp. multiplex Griffin-1]ACA11248.1 ATP-dependent RNA helicase [Xylella fastidiosa M12]KAJ4852573.1 DEAD/DEAH box helicase [Xylella fastidiosa subsp. multiplex]KFA41582.1 ATP-dependent RNA helicase [Xylella fastidiosa]MBE0268162.1 DEAD/DEAH box helicase [Xylella fastidiosa subsp. multiplex]
MSNPSSTPLLFADLGLSDAVMQAVTKIGYETPSPIQAATIPALLAGRDVLGQAQTGTGKTAAFALPLLTRTVLNQVKPQVLVLAPTRELAIQVAEAFQRYAASISGFRVLPVYGGQSYGQQLAALKRGVHVIVGTPGRVIDHLERGTLDLSELKTLVLDEADEMLRMGFIEDVEEVLRKLPASRQVALFSATMPPQIRRIAQTYLQDPIEVTIATKTTTAANIRQRYWWVSGLHKLDALTRILEVETFDAMIIFVRTKAATEELAEKLQARGLTAAAINGDMQQAQRERTIHQLKDGKLDILVATDVAARGLDVERISHVLNYDIPYDVESYVHRIGRTGRAGRSGEAILFVTPREKGMLRQIERATHQPIEAMQLPSVDAVNDTRVTKFFGRISNALVVGAEIDFYRKLLQRFESEHNVPAIEIAAALARLLQGDSPFLLSVPTRPQRERSELASEHHVKRPSSFKQTERPNNTEHPKRPQRNAPARNVPEFGMESYRIEVGRMHGVKPANIVGAIANEAGLESRYIGRIDIRDDHSVLDLPAEMPHEILQHLKKVWVSGQQLQMHRIDTTETTAPAREFKSKPGGAGKFPPKPHHNKSTKPKPPYSG